MPDGEENINVNDAESNFSSNNEENVVNETTKDDKEKKEVANSTEKEELYSIQYLIDNCKALGYKKEVVAGALFSCEKTEMTKAEFEEEIKNFLGKAVK